MPRPASLGAAALPTGTTEAQRAGSPSTLFVLADAKSFIGMPLEQTDADAHIQLLITQAQALVEEASGLECAPATGATCEYVLGDGVRALCIPESDVAAVTSVVEYDDDGVETGLDAADYDVKRSFGRSYILRVDDECFPASCDGGLSALATYDRGIAEGSKLADIYKAAMGHLVAGLYSGDGTSVSDDRARKNPDYLRAIRLLENQVSLT